MGRRAKISVVVDGKQKNVPRICKLMEEKLTDWAEYAIMNTLIAWGKELLEDAKENAGYSNFTGNTITSIAFGLYIDDALRGIYYIGGCKKPVHAKVKKGEYINLKPDYDGNYRREGITGEVDVDDSTGLETSVRILRDARPPFHNGIIITTGTEYTQYVERILMKNVLTETYQKAAQESYKYFFNALKKYNNQV